jgi:hypothetical protein
LPAPSLLRIECDPARFGPNLGDKLVATAAIRDRIYLLELGVHKDASGLYLSNREGFKSSFKAALKNATSLSDTLEAEREAEARMAWAECEDLALVGHLPCT